MRHINVFSLTMGVLVLGILSFSMFVWAQPQDVNPPLGANPPEPILAQAPRGPEPPEFEPGPDEGVDEIRINWRELQLAPEQRQQLQQKRREFQINTAGMRQELKFLEQDLREEMLNDSVDRAKIDGLLQRIAQLRQQISTAAIQNLLEIKALLTPEQLERLAEFQMQMPPEFWGIQLTPEQRSHIRDLMKNSMQQTRTTAQELQELRMELREVLLSTEVDTGKLQQLQTAIAEKELALGKGRIEMLLQVKALLTPEQLKQFQKKRAPQQDFIKKRK